MKKKNKDNKILSFLNENKYFFISVVIIFDLGIYKLPYYIDMPGGLIKVNNRISITEENKLEGSYNLAYVSEVPATPILYVLAKILPSWDLLKKEDMTYNNMTIEEMNEFERLLLKIGENQAKLAAYTRANKTTTVSDTKIKVGLIENTKTTDLKVNDIILKVDGMDFTDVDDFKEMIQNKNVGDIITFEVLNKEDIYTRTAKVYEAEGKKVVGIYLFEDQNITTDPECNIKTNSKEMGPSGGLMTALTIYDKLTKEDLTKGRKISGTGTIDADGTVGEIGGVKYKLAGVVKKHADIFFVPKGENYNEAIKLQKKHNYKIKIVAVETIDDAINYLRNN